MKTFRVTYSEDDVYCNVDVIPFVENEHLGTFSNLKKCEKIIDSHYCKRYPGEKWNNNYGAAKKGQILKKKKKIKDGFCYPAGLVSYNITIEKIQ